MANGPIPVDDRNRSHTCSMNQSYHDCPCCGYIVEFRKGAIVTHEGKKKIVTCTRCQERFIAKGE